MTSVIAECSGPADRVSRSCVLVVDDDPLMLDLMEEILRFGGYAVLRAPSAEAALAMVTAVKPGAALVDLVLPGMDGVYLIEQLQPGLPPSAVIVMTGHREHPRLEVARHLGVGAVLHKPVGVNQVLDAVGAACA